MLLLKQQPDGIYVVCEVESAVPFARLLDVTQRLAGLVCESVGKIRSLSQTPKKGDYQGNLGFVQPQSFSKGTEETVATPTSEEHLRLLLRTSFLRTLLPRHSPPTIANATTTSAAQPPATSAAPVQPAKTNSSGSPGDTTSAPSKTSSGAWSVVHDF